MRAFAETVKETYGINAMAPFSGSSYDLKEGCFVTVTKGYSDSETGSERSNEESGWCICPPVAACDRLRRVVMHNEGGATKI